MDLNSIAFVNILKTFGVEEKVRSLNNYQMGSLIYIVRALQILSITGDNTSNNDSMIKYLSDTIDDFPGPANQTWCFVHTVNLIAKSILKPFDAQKTKGIGSFNDALSIPHLLNHLICSTPSWMPPLLPRGMTNFNGTLRQI